MKLVYLLIFFALSFFSCSSDDTVSIAKPVEIRVSTGFVAGGMESRGGGSIYTGNMLGGISLPLSVVRVDQESEFSAAFFPYTLVNTNGVGQAPRSARLAGENGGLWVFFDPVERYLLRASNNSTKLIGWYPAVHTDGSVWSVDGGMATVSFDIDGDTDILFSGLVEGSVDTPFNDPNNGNGLVFNHLLTRLMVRVFTVDPNTDAIWGGLVGITLMDTPQTCAVRLPDVESASSTFPGDIVGSLVFSGNGELPVYGASGDAPLVIPVVDEQEKETIGEHDYVKGTAFAGSVLSAPVGSGSITLEVVTEKSTKLVGIPVPEGGFAAGNSYTLSLRFKDSGIVLSNVSITPWEVASDVPLEIGGE